MWCTVVSTSIHITSNILLMTVKAEPSVCKSTTVDTTFDFYQSPSERQHTQPSVVALVLNRFCLRLDSRQDVSPGT